MNGIPAIGFYWRRHLQINRLIESGNKDGGHTIVDLAKALLPFVKEHFPKCNEDGILDDLVQTLEQMFQQQGKS